MNHNLECDYTLPCTGTLVTLRKGEVQNNIFKMYYGSQIKTVDSRCYLKGKVKPQPVACVIGIRWIMW